MNGTKMSVAAVGIAIVLFAAVGIAASSQISSTPLYTMRMEQVSSKMNFLPTEMNGFAYTAEPGYTLTCAIAGCRGGGAVPLNTKPGDTYCESCVIETCEETCDWTCFETCLYTCQDTCSETCGQKVTCEFGFTCNWPTCCWPTCMGC